MKFKLIMTFIKPATTGDVVDAMKEAGATGATIIPGRGTECFSGYQQAI